MTDHWRASLLAIAALTVSPGSARADSAVITSGSVSLTWDGSLSGIDLIGSGTHLMAEHLETPPNQMRAGNVQDLSRTSGTSTMSHPVSATVNGTTYSSVWVKGQFTISAAPFTLPYEATGTSHFFSTPMTMTGQFLGYSDPEMTNQVFAASLSGSGVASIGPMRVVADGLYVMNSGGLVYRFTAPLPAPWSSSDVGSVGRSGIASFDNGRYFVSGAGSDIWWTDDSFQFVNQTLAGDGEIVARVTGLSDTDTFAKAGVMLRDSLTSNASDVILDLRPTGDIEFMTRGSDGETTRYLGGDIQAPPAWLRLSRSAGTVLAGVSADGVSWRTVGSTPFTTQRAVFAGLAVTSHDAGALNTSTFDNVRVTPASPSTPGDVVVYASDIPASSIHGAWTAMPDATAAAGVALVTPDADVSHTTAPVPLPADYVDVTFAADAGTPYTIWLRLQAAANSKWNDSVWVQFSDAQSAGSNIYQSGTELGLLVNLATDSAATSLNQWGWKNSAYWLSQPATVTFASSGLHTMRIQVREDGVRFDQIVLSPQTYLSSPPGPDTNDSTVVHKP
jgi:hypothetical protein